MNKYFEKFQVLLGVILILFSSAENVNVEKLIERMTNEEKCGQMTMLTFDVVQKEKKPTNSDENPLDYEKLVNAIKNNNCGSIHNTPYNQAQKAETWQKIIRLIQDVALNQTSLKIPIIYGLDSIHGANYIREAVLFPQPLAMASTFNPDIAFKIGEITSLETRSIGVPWNYNPVLDVGRQPLWSRLFETYGEDVYLTVKMGEAYIKGHQGTNDFKDRKHAATCLKHFIGYSFPFNGRDRTSAYIPEIMLRETFLPPFEAGVLAGSPSVMINSAEVNSIPGHANKYYINGILKGELKFTGLVVSDWEDVIRLHTRDKIAETPEEAVRLAVMSGIDMSIVPFDFSFYYHCINLTRKDNKFLQRVNEAVINVLKLKTKLGLFENPYPDSADLKNIGTNESENLNLEAARESIILTKNENKILPLNLDKLFSDSSKLLVTGPSGNLLRILNGGWSYSWNGENEDYFKEFGRNKSTIFESIKEIYLNANFSEGANFTHLTNLEETIQMAKQADYIILCLGEDSFIETPGNINNLILSDSQIKLADSLFELKKPIILIYISGRPRIITEIVEKSQAVLMSFLPGYKGSNAIAEILFGKYNPNGKLPITYPSNPNGISTYDYKPLEVYDVNYVYNLYHFGHGLSYTEFKYESVELSTRELEPPNNLKVKVKVRNIGDYDGLETVLLYINDEYGSVSRPVKQLKGFQKTLIRKGEVKEIEFVLDINKDLSFIGINNKRIVESGKFNIFVGHLNSSFVLRMPSNVNSANIHVYSIKIFGLFLAIFYLFIRYFK